MLALAFLVMGQPTVDEAPAPPLVIDVPAKPCREDGGADVTVCARRTDRYRIDPSVLAAQRRREALPVDNRSSQERSIVRDCTAEADKWQGSGVIPILPVAVKTVTAVVLAAKGEDWREAFRTKPDEYRAYQADQERRRSRIGIGISAGSPTSGPR